MDGVNFVMRKQLDEERIFTNPDACRRCNGLCCKGCGCVFSPDDFYVFRNSFSKEERLRYVIAFLKRGYASIDHVRMYDKIGGAIEFFGAMTIPVEKGFELSKEKLLNGDGALYLRMRNKGHGVLDFLHLPSYHTDGCVFLTEKGCKVPFNKRPKGGRLLRPRVDSFRDCSTTYPEIQAGIDWHLYQDILFEAYEYFRHN